VRPRAATPGRQWWCSPAAVTGFAIALYPGHLWAHEDEDHATRDETDLSLRPDIPVRADSPPTFLLQAEDDHVDGVEQSLAYMVDAALAR
jgi:hypothetical protein